MAGNRNSLSADILLFDMDGTLLDATPVIARIWTTWAERFGIDAARLLVTSRGQRVADTLRAYAPPGTDLAAEERWLSRQAHIEPTGPAAVKGATELLKALPPKRWAIVTSAERTLAVRWLSQAGLPMPGVMIAADDVVAGKPDPAGYCLAATRLGHDIARAVVFEDAVLGIEAGRAAGAKVVGVANPALAAHADLAFWLPDFTALSVDVSPANAMTLQRLS